MDKFVIRKALKTTPENNWRKSLTSEEEDVDGTQEGGRREKRARLETSHLKEPPLLASTSWQQIRAKGLNCDYVILFGKAEADRIFQELEKEVEYFQGKRVESSL